MRVLVTGGCGFLGSHVCELFRRRGWEVVSYDNMTKAELDRTGYQTDRARHYNWEQLEKLGVQMVRADVRDLDELLDHASGCDYLAHTAAQPAVTISMEDPLLDLSTNVVGTVHVLEAARRHGLPVASCATVHVYGNWVNETLAIRVTRLDPGPVVQQAGENLAASGVARKRQRTAGIAMIALVAADYYVLVFAALRQPVLAHEFYRGFVRLGATRQKVNARARFAESISESCGKLLLRFVGKESRVGVRKFVELRLNCRKHIRVSVAEATDRSSTAAVEVLLALAVVQVHALSADAARIRLSRISIENTAHVETFQTPRLRSARSRKRLNGTPAATPAKRNPNPGIALGVLTGTL